MNMMFPKPTKQKKRKKHKKASCNQKATAGATCACYWMEILHTSHIWKSIMFCLVTPMHLQRRKG